MTNMTSVQDFDNPEVRGAVNPHPTLGYFHGPITNNNLGFQPAEAVAAIANGRKPPAVTTAMNDSAPNQMEKLSLCNGLVCMIDVNGGQMCGMTFGDQPTLRRHMRNAHTGAISSPGRANLSQQEEIAGDNALKLYVLSQSWRIARFQREPGVCHPNSRIGQFATVLEIIAASDAAFAARWGTHFHRTSDPSHRARLASNTKQKAHMRLTHAMSILAAVSESDINGRRQSTENSADISEALAEHMPADRQPAAATPSSRRKRKVGRPALPRSERSESPSAGRDPSKRPRNATKGSPARARQSTRQRGQAAV